jgi:trans-aconitate methyltransferase
MSFRDVSKDITKSLSKDTKQSQGIFFTPKSARDAVIELVLPYATDPKTILEPSFGSGEFLEDLYERFPNATITGVELNSTLFNLSKRPNIHNVDFLSYKGKHEVIIGNPPYFVIQKSAETDLCQSGRPNMFVQFLYKSMTENLTPSGILAFVLPTSFFNCAYYGRMRKWLYDNATILHAKRLEGEYIDTQQETFALVVQYRPSSTKDFFIQLNTHTYITPLYKELIELTKNTRTLNTLGYSVKTGEVVWNQEKEKLQDSGTLLIYSSNLTTGKLLVGNLKTPKKQYIEGFTRPPLTGRSILINRGYGNSAFTFTPVLVDESAYYCENHVNVIRPTQAASLPIEDVLRSLRDPRTQKFIEYFVGNGALSKTEVECCLPIWIS